MKYKTNPKINYSEIKWIGEIPEEWDVRQPKFTTNFELDTVDRHDYDK